MSCDLNLNFFLHLTRFKEMIYSNTAVKVSVECMGTTEKWRPGPI